MMKNYFKIFVAIILLLITFSCENKKSNTVNIYAVPSGMKIENYTDSSIGYMLIQEEFVPLLDWCISCTETNQVASNKSVFVDSSQILGYEKGKTITIFYWNCPYESGDDLEIEKVIAKIKRDGPNEKNNYYNAPVVDDYRLFFSDKKY